MFFFFQAEDGIRDGHVTGVQTCALPISITPPRLTKPVAVRQARPGMNEPMRPAIKRKRPGRICRMKAPTLGTIPATGPRTLGKTHGKALRIRGMTLGMVLKMPGIVPATALKTPGKTLAILCMTPPTDRRVKRQCWYGKIGRASCREKE